MNMSFYSSRFAFLVVQLFVLATITPQNANGQTTQEPIRVAVLRTSINDNMKDTNNYLFSFWLARKNKNEIYLIFNQKPTAINKKINNGVYFDKNFYPFQGQLVAYYARERLPSSGRWAHDALVIKNGNNPFRKLDFLLDIRANDRFRNKGNVWYYKKGQDWHCCYDKNAHVICARRANAKENEPILVFASYEHLDAVLHPKTLAFVKNLCPGQQQQNTLTLIADWFPRFDHATLENPLFITAEKRHDALLYWKEKENGKAIFLWLPALDNRPAGLAFASQNANIWLKVDNAVFTRLVKRALVPCNTCVKKQAPGHKRLMVDQSLVHWPALRLAKRCQRNLPKLSEYPGWAPKNRYQAQWFGNVPTVPSNFGNKKVDRLAVPGMYQLCFALVNDNGQGLSELKNALPEKDVELHEHQNHYWPSVIYFPEKQSLPAFCFVHLNGSNTYIHWSELSTSQYLGHTGLLEEPQKAFAVHNKNDVWIMLNQNRGPKRDELTKKVKDKNNWYYVPAMQMYQMWQLLKSNWATSNNEEREQALAALVFSNLVIGLDKETISIASPDQSRLFQWWSADRLFTLRIMAREGQQGKAQSLLQRTTAYDARRLRFNRVNDPEFNRVWAYYEHDHPFGNTPDRFPVVFVRAFAKIPLRTKRQCIESTIDAGFACRIAVFRYGEPQAVTDAHLRLPTTDELRKHFKHNYANNPNLNVQEKDSPLVSEWVCDNGQFKVVGVNRWSDCKVIQDALKRGIPINAKNGIPDFVSPVIGIRWVIEITPPGQNKRPAQPKQGNGATSVQLNCDERKLDTYLISCIEVLFGGDSNGVIRSINDNFGNHPYWKLQYLRYLVCSGAWGWKNEKGEICLDKRNDDGPWTPVPLDDITDGQLLKLLKRLLCQKK